MDIKYDIEKWEVTTTFPKKQVSQKKQNKK